MMIRARSGSEGHIEVNGIFGYEACLILPVFQDAVMVGLHTCGDLAPSTLRMFEAKQELRAVCSVGCCYHLLSEEFDENAQGK